MLAAGCEVSSAALITSTGDGDVASVRSVRRVPSTTMSFDGSGVALAASGTLSCTALAGAGAGAAPSCPLPGVAAKASDHPKPPFEKWPSGSSPSSPFQAADSPWRACGNCVDRVDDDRLPGFVFAMIWQ